MPSLIDSKTLLVIAGIVVGYAFGKDIGAIIGGTIAFVIVKNID